MVHVSPRKAIVKSDDERWFVSRLAKRSASTSHATLCRLQSEGIDRPAGYFGGLCEESAAMTEQERLRTAVEALCREMLAPIFEHLNANVVPFDSKMAESKSYFVICTNSHALPVLLASGGLVIGTDAVPRCRCDPIGAPAKPNRWGQTSTGKAATQTAAVWQ